MQWTTFLLSTAWGHLPPNTKTTVMAKSIEITLMFGFTDFRSALFWFQVEAVRLIAEGKAARIIQPQEGATYECIQKKDNSKVTYKDTQIENLFQLIIHL